MQEKAYNQFLNNLFSVASQPEIREKADKLSDKELRVYMNQILDKKGVDEQSTLKFSKQFILGLLKPTYSREGYCYFDEREWRAFFMDDQNNPWIWECDSLSKEDKKTLNSHIETSDEGFITIPDNWFNMINYIIVKKESQILPLIHFIKNAKNLFGNDNLIEDQRLFLISRIISFERLNADI